MPSLRKKGNSFKTFTLCRVHIVQWHSIYGTAKSRVHTNTYTLHKQYLCYLLQHIFKTNNSTDQRLTQPGPCIIPRGSDGASTQCQVVPLNFPSMGFYCDIMSYATHQQAPTYQLRSCERVTHNIGCCERLVCHALMTGLNFVCPQI